MRHIYVHHGEFLTVEILLPDKGFLMLYVMFEERLGSRWHDLFAKTAVLAVSVGPRFYGFLMEKQLYLVLALQNAS